ncbi:MAG: hypothetical protein ACO39Y_08740 [Ilumatobacteraceae bacterium]
MSCENLTEAEKPSHQQALADFLDHLDAVHGPLDTEEDEREIARFMSLLRD